MNFVRQVAERAFHRSGAMTLIRAAKRNRGRILMYHGFAGTPSEIRERLTRQCEHLRRYYTPVTLSEIAECVRTGSVLPPNSLTITVDDGYRDLATAFPVFRSFGLPVTVYVVSDFADGLLWLWTDQVKHAYRSGQRFEAAEPEPPFEHMMQIANAERLRMLQSLDVAAGPPPGCEALSWTELSALSVQGLEIGAHSRTHPILSRLETREQRIDEIAGSKRLIEEALGTKVRHFCYPNGRVQDYDTAAVEAVRDAGYETAVTTVPGLVGAGSDLLQLPRLGVEPDDPPLSFERWVSGLHQR